jgi:transposase
MIIFNKILKNILVNIITANKKNGRPYSLNIGHYLDVIFYVLKTGINWEDLIYYKNKLLHHQGYYYNFKKWSKNGYFEKAYIIMSKLYSKKSSLYFIDSKSIQNRHGFKYDVSMGYKHKSKNANKLNAIVDEIGQPISLHLTKGNISDNNTDFLVDTLNKTTINLENSTLVGDKGYSSQKNVNLVNSTNKIKLLVAPKKSKLNPNPYISPNDDILFKKRAISEHSFSWISNYKRLLMRFDRYTNNFNSFICFAYANIICNKNQ